MIPQPTPERLLGVRVTPTPDGGAHLTVHSRTPDGQLVQTDYVTAEPYVADMLRRAATAIPDQACAPADTAEIQRRLQHIAN